MILERRISYLVELGDYMQSRDASWEEAKRQASLANGWFIPEFVELSIKNIAENFLRRELLEDWISRYNPARPDKQSRAIGVVMAGNIPLVGFHDFLAVLMSCHRVIIKASSKDDILIKHLAAVLTKWDKEFEELIRFADLLKKCDGYIATGSNNTSRYFEAYFGKYPHIIRRNRTSVAVLDGKESVDDLTALSDDVYQFFGLGCRNVTKLYVPQQYNFELLLSCFGKYNYLADHHKYKNNYDYNLAIHILNNKFYMTNGSILLIEDTSVFSPISQLNYEYYSDKAAVLASLNKSQQIQTIVGRGHVPFGRSQSPGLSDYADGTDTMAFLKSL